MGRYPKLARLGYLCFLFELYDYITSQVFNYVKLCRIWKSLSSRLILMVWILFLWTVLCFIILKRVYMEEIEW